MSQKSQVNLGKLFRCPTPLGYRGFCMMLESSATILMDAAQTDAANFNDDIVYTSPKEPTGVWNDMAKRMQEKCTAFRKKTDAISR